MKNNGKFTRYTPKKPVRTNVLHLKNEKNTDWYTLIRNTDRMKNSHYALTDDAGNICCISDDISKLTPVNMTVWEIPASELPVDFAGSWMEMTIINGVLSHNHQAKAEKEKNRLLTEAKNKITVFQYAVDLGIATPEELKQLDEWKEYVVMMGRVST